jgi:hypothetical protein
MQPGQRVDAVRACKAKEILCLGIKSCTMPASSQQALVHRERKASFFLQTTLCVLICITSANNTITPDHCFVILLLRMQVIYIFNY